MPSSMCELQYKFSFSLVCRLETYFGLVQDYFGSVQGCFVQFGSRLLRRFKVASVWFKIPSVRFGSRLLQQFKVASVWFKIPLVQFKVASV